MSASNRAGRRVTLLILEDSPHVRERLVAELRMLHCVKRIIECETVAGATQLIDSEKPEVAVLDLQLPDGSGLQVLDHIGRSARPCSALVLSSASEASAREASERRGARAFLPKTADIDVIASTVVTLANEPVEEQPVQPFNRLAQQDSPAEELPAEVIQARCFAGETCVLDFVALAHGNGRVHIRAGQVVHASVGDAIGLEALTLILRSKGSRLVETTDPNDRATTSHEMNWHAAAKEALRLAVSCFRSC